ncbi:MAG: GDP-mannose 4,6-dehydratase [Dehalococcoidia bacterium]|jgi:GDP-4-dehydro-6-deoxy-D-mannose reductase
MRVLITGGAGFVGSHLAEHIKTIQPDAQIFAADRWLTRKDNISHLMWMINYREFDMTDYGSMLNLVREVMPDRIFHLAAQSFVPNSWQAPAETMNTNIMGELNLFEAVRAAGINPAIQVAGSSEEYGLVLPDETPIRETNPLRPLSPYAVSKIAQDYLGYQYWQSYGMRIVRTRAFNHTGPRRGEQFATSSFARQVAEIEAGLRTAHIMVGNLDAERDFTDVRDIVRGYWMLTEPHVVRDGCVFNLCSGTHRTMRQVIETIIQVSGMTKPVELIVDPDRQRPSDVPLLYGDYTKMREITGWAPVIPFEQTMLDLLNYWRDRIKKEQVAI